MTEYDYSDLELVPLDEGEHPLASIAYAEEYKQASGLLRALMAKDEKSERGLEVAAQVIALNPAHYTVWAYRLSVLKAFAAEVLEAPQDATSAEIEDKKNAILRELPWVDVIAHESPKNYQIWPHRQQLLELFEAHPELTEDSEGPELKREIELIDDMLLEDSKNHHVWSYRQWLVTRFPKIVELDSELATTSLMLSDDCRNNSAWNHRFLVFSLKNGMDTETSTTATSRKLKWTCSRSFDDEVAFVKETIDKAPQNQSPWLYLEGLFQTYERDVCELQDLTFKYACLPSDLKDDEEPLITSSHALDLLAKIYVLQKDKAKALEALDLLETKYDPIRKGYWSHRKKLVSA